MRFNKLEPRRAVTVKVAAVISAALLTCGFATEIPLPQDSSSSAAPFESREPQAVYSTDPQQMARDVASVHFPMLTYAQIYKMPSKDVVRYYRNLHKLMAELERFQLTDKKSDKVARVLQQLFLNESHAGSESLPPYKVGTECLIGGYWGQWTYRRDIPGISNKNGMTCNSPNRCSLPGDSGGQQSGHMCNPKYFTYANSSSRSEWCVNLKKDLTSNGCIALLEKRYSEMCDGHDQECRPFADHFKRSILQAIAADAKYQGISEGEAIDQYKNEVFTEFSRIRDYCGDTKVDWDRHSAGQQYSCFRLMSHYQQLQRTVAEIAPKPAPQPLPPPRYTPPPAGNNSPDSALGPYACIKQGLVAAGYTHASNRAIAMFAVRAKDQADDSFFSWMSSGQRRQDNTMTNTILAISGVGVCQGMPLSADEARRTNYWLCKDKLSDLHSGEYKRIFGVEPQRVIPRGGWSNYDFKQRRGAWESNVNHPDIRSCPRKPTASESLRICRIMHRACRMDEQGCEFRIPEHGGGDGGNGDTGGPSGPGGPGPGNTTGPSGNAESGAGSNDGAGHGGDAGGGHGSGPGG